MKDRGARRDSASRVSAVDLWSKEINCELSSRPLRGYPPKKTAKRSSTQLTTLPPQSPSRRISRSRSISPRTRRFRGRPGAVWAGHASPGRQGADVWSKINGHELGGACMSRRFQVDLPMSCLHDFRSVVKMIGAPKMAVRRSCDVTVGSYLLGDTASGDRAIGKQLTVSGRIELRGAH